MIPAGRFTSWQSHRKAARQRAGGGGPCTYRAVRASGHNAEPQRLRALERANEVRLARAELKRRIAGGDVSAADIILGCPQEAISWSMRELLMSQRRWGSKRCRIFLERNQIGELKCIGQLTDRQKHLLAGQLSEIGGEPPIGRLAPVGDPPPSLGPAAVLQLA
jgi:hypothetical protein